MSPFSQPLILWGFLTLTQFSFLNGLRALPKTWIRPEETQGCRAAPTISSGATILATPWGLRCSESKLAYPGWLLRIRKWKAVILEPKEGSSCQLPRDAALSPGCLFNPDNPSLEAEGSAAACVGGSQARPGLECAGPASRSTMSWPGEDWKVGLPAQALRAIAEVEQHLARLQKERQQKQVQLDTLEAAMHKQRQKHEEERASWALLSQQNRSLAEGQEQMERARQRLAQELQAKEGQLSCLEAQLVQATRRQAELEEELRRCQVELEKLRSQSNLVLLPPRWGSPTPWAEGGAEAKAEPSKTPGAGKRVQCSSRTAGGPNWAKEPGTLLPTAPPGSPSPTENGGGDCSAAAEAASVGERLKRENQGLQLALAKAESRMREQEREVWNLQGQLGLAQAELARWKKQRGDQAEARAPAAQGRRLSEDVSAQHRSRDHQKGPAGTERASSGSSRRSVSSSRLEQPAEKRAAPGKQKGLPSLSLRAPGTEQEELQALRAQVLTLRRRLEASEVQRKSLFETCGQQPKAPLWLQAGQTPLPQHQRRGSRALPGDGQAAPNEQGMGNGDHAVAGAVASGGQWAEEQLEGQAEEKTALRARAAEEVPGKTDVPAPPVAEAEGLAQTPMSARGGADAEGNVEALREDLRALAAGKAEAEAQASLVQQKLQNLQAMVGRQTERLAQAMEAQSRHVGELLVDVEEKDRLMDGLRQELEETRRALNLADAKGRRLQALLGERLGGPHETSPTEAPVAELQGGKGCAGDGSLAECPREEVQAQPGVQEQLETFLAQLLRENQALREELASWKTWSQEKESNSTLTPLESACAGNSGEGEPEIVLEAAQVEEPSLRGSWRSVQTQTEVGHRRRERVSVAFDNTQYEPYGLPEVVMKGFADIPSGPSCPYVLRRGILGSAPIAQLAPRAEPEEDFPEAEEGTGV
ncbi:centromere protein F-like isoform X2 [Varanus komodoensis]|uniref:centromere protein F-like isoform X2 n=1 Tax=Varanus komodoensis TaxID=61221 RepID=UPI001CF78FDC|nr:centromere protein F-like isoform X2 [Varanus komodoensis]